MGQLRCNKCGKPITFDDGFVSPSGKKIPLDEIEGVGLAPHECPDISLNSLNERLTRIENLIGNSEVPMTRIFKLEQKIAEQEMIIKSLKMRLELTSR